eukprot:6211881-Pleurochrysis_carterae.AAC.2
MGTDGQELLFELTLERDAAERLYRGEGVQPRQRAHVAEQRRGVLVPEQRAEGRRYVRLTKRAVGRCMQLDHHLLSTLRVAQRLLAQHVLPPHLRLVSEPDHRAHRADLILLHTQADQNVDALAAARADHARDQLAAHAVEKRRVKHGVEPIAVGDDDEARDEVLPDGPQAITHEELAHLVIPQVDAPRRVQPEHGGAQSELLAAHDCGGAESPAAATADARDADVAAGSTPVVGTAVVGNCVVGTAVVGTSAAGAAAAAAASGAGAVATDALAGNAATASGVGGATAARYHTNLARATTAAHAHISHASAKDAGSTASSAIAAYDAPTSPLALTSEPPPVPKREQSEQLSSDRI